MEPMQAAMQKESRNWGSSQWMKLRTASISSCRMLSTPAMMTTLYEGGMGEKRRRGVG